MIIDCVTVRFEYTNITKLVDEESDCISQYQTNREEKQGLFLQVNKIRTSFSFYSNEIPCEDIRQRYSITLTTRSQLISEAKSVPMA